MIYLKAINHKDGEVRQVSLLSGRRYHVSPRAVTIEDSDDTSYTVHINDSPEDGDWRFWVMNAQGDTIDKFTAFSSTGVPMNAL